MLSIDFANLRDRHSEYTQVWDQLADWVQQNPKVKFILPHLVAREIDVELGSLNEVFEILINENGFAQVYRVLHPQSQTLLPGEWESPAQIPQRIPDRSFHVIERDEAKIVPVLIPEQR